MPPAHGGAWLLLARGFAQITECLRATVKPDTIMVLPALPFPPPKRNAPEVRVRVCVRLLVSRVCLAWVGAHAALSPTAATLLNPPAHAATASAATAAAAPQIEHTVFTKLATCFNAFAVLGGCPTLIAPVGSLRDGSPVAISLLAVHK